MNNSDVITLRAFLQALAQQDRRLPDDLQRSLQQIGHDLNTQPEVALTSLRALVERDPDLKQPYSYWEKQYIAQEYPTVYLHLRMQPKKRGFGSLVLQSFQRWRTTLLSLRNRITQQRTRNLSLTLDGCSGLDLLTLIQKVFSADDPVVKAKQTLQYLSAQAKTSQRSLLWEVGDRVVAMAAGGAALGALLGQIPGAILGAVFAGIYGWYSSDARTHHARKIE